MISVYFRKSAYKATNFFFLLAVAALSNGCAAGLSNSGGVCASNGLANLSFSTSSLDFGTRSFGSLTDTTVTITNAGSGPARQVTGIAESPFSFAGGTFPGTGGTCAAVLQGKASCTVVVRFSAPAPPVSSQSKSISFSYFDGRNSTLLNLPLAGQGNNGAFNQARGVSRAVSTVAPTPTGVWLGGSFESFNTSRARRIAKFDSAAALDPSLGALTGFDNLTSSVALAADGSGDVYAVGSFTSYNGASNINYIARLNSDGSLDTGFNIGAGASAGFNNIAYVVAPATDASGDVYVGGAFSSYNGSTNINQIVRLNSDGSIDAAFNIGAGATAGFNGGVRTLAVATDASGDVYVGGQFTSYNSNANRNRIIRLNSDGSVDAGFNIGAGASAGFDSFVYSVAPAIDGSGDVYVGGIFTSYNSTANVNRITRLNSDGSIDAGFNIGAGASAGLNITVQSIAAAVDGSFDVYVGGDFTSYNGSTNIRRITRLNSDGTIDSAFNIGSGSTAGFDSTVSVVSAATDGSFDVYVGGLFTSFNGNSNVFYVARLNSDGSIDSGFSSLSGGGSGFSSFVYSVAAALDGSGDVYAGGNFSVFNGGTATGTIARLNSDGTLDTGFNTGSGVSAGFDTIVRTVAVSLEANGDVYVGGDFSTYNGNTNTNRISRLNSDGSLDAGFNIGSGASAGFDNNVLSIAPAVDASGDVYVAGRFTVYNTTTNINRIVRLNSDGTIDAGFNTGVGATAGFNGDANVVVAATDGSGDIYVGGLFTSYNATANINYITRLNSNGSIDAGFNIGAGASAGFNSTVWSLAVASDASGDIYIGGNFVSYNSNFNINRIVRLNNDGSIDAAFNIGSGASAGFNNLPTGIVVAGDGSGDVYVGGNFASYNGTSNVNRITRLNSDGSIDLAFNTGSGVSAGFSDNVRSLAVSLDGSFDVYVGGDFSSYSSTTLGYIARLSPVGAVD